MVDYFPVLKGAVSALDPNTPEARRALYDRARRALIDGLRASDPTLSDTDLRKQSAALEGAIRQVEEQFGPPDEPRAAAPPPRPAAPPPPSSPRAAAPAAPPVASQRVAPPPVAAAAPDDREPQISVEDYADDRPPLDDERKPYRLIAMGVAGLSVLMVGALAYSFWPSRSKTPPAQRTATASAPSATTTPSTSPRRVDADSTGAGGAGYVFLRQPVYYRTNHPVGTIVVDKSQNFLYVVRPSVSAIRYGIGVGPECYTTAGLYQVVRKEEWPGLAGRQLGDDERTKSPFGARALYLSKESRIHGTNTPTSIGRPASIGCIRLTNDDVIHLYDRAPLDTRVIVVN